MLVNANGHDCHVGISAVLNSANTRRQTQTRAQACRRVTCHNATVDPINHMLVDLVPMLPYRIPPLRHKRLSKTPLIKPEKPVGRRADLQAFLGEWARRPLRVAAVAPSSRRLGDLVTSEIDIDQGPVLVLGPGTGVFPNALARRGIQANRMALVELNPRFFELLSKRMPEVKILQADAACADLTSFGYEQPFSAAVSGLGLLSMKRQTVRDILKNCFDHLAQGGALYQFTYGLRCPVPADVMAELGLQAQKIGWVAMNMPPARVYKISRA